jgi:hypothetical protein
MVVERAAPSSALVKFLTKISNCHASAVTVRPNVRVDVGVEVSVGVSNDEASISVGEPVFDVGHPARPTHSIRRKQICRLMFRK